MVTQSSLAPGEDYASASDLLEYDDLKHLTLRVWDKPVRVRGLSLLEREEIRAACWRKDGQRDVGAMVREYIRCGMVAPQLNHEQAERFVRKHAASVEQLYLLISDLTELDYELVVAQASAIAGLAPSAEPDTGGGADSAGGGSVDRQPRPTRRRR